MRYVRLTEAKQILFIRDIKPILSSERMLNKGHSRKSLFEKKKDLGAVLKGLDAKTKWLVVNRPSYSIIDYDFEQLSFVKPSVKRKLSRCNWELAGNEVNGEAEEPPLLEAVTRERLAKIQRPEKLSVCCSDLWNVEISDSAIIKCSHKSCVNVVNKSDLKSKPRL
jgi:hypothetical protein